MAPTPEKLAEWQQRAAKKGAIVPAFFEVTARTALIKCGNCGTKFQRTLIPKLDEPTFVCPNDACRAKNWIPLRYDIR